MVALWTLAAAIVGGRLPLLLMTSFRPPALPGPRATGRGRSGSWWRRRSRCPRSWWSRGAPVAQRPRCQGASERRGRGASLAHPVQQLHPCPSRWRFRVAVGEDFGSPSGMWGERRGDRPPLGDVAAGASIPRHRPPRQGRNRSLARRASGPALRGALRTPGQPGVPPRWPPRRPTWGEHRARAGEFWSARRLTEGGRPGRVVRHHPARLPVSR